MNADQVEKMWSQALEEAKAAGEPNARHRFADAIRASTKEEDAKICDRIDEDEWDYSNADLCASAIRASK